MSQRACRNCRLLSRERVCPNCRGTDFSEDYTGLLIILDIEKSELARMAGLKEKGHYALRAR